MPHIKLGVPVIIAMLVAGVLLTTSNPGFSQPVQAAPNEQDIPAFEVHTEMVPSNWPMIPSGLGPGDSFRLMYVTEGTRDGTSDNINDYNLFVRDAAGWNSHFKDHMKLLFTALVSVHGGIDARGVTRTRKPEVGNDPGHDSPIYWVQGEKVADSYADFYDGSWDSRKARTSTGATFTNSDLEVWTGSTHEGTHATTDTGWGVGLGSPPAWWYFGTRLVAKGDIGSKYHGTTGEELYSVVGNATEQSVFYGISPVFKIRSTTGPKPIIKGPTGTVRGPFDVTISFPDDYRIIGMGQDSIRITGGRLSNFRHTAGAGTATGDKADETGTVYTVTVTPDYSSTISDTRTVSLTIWPGAVKDTNDWFSVAADTYTVQSSFLAIPFDSDGVGTVPRDWALIPSTELEPGDGFRLLFVTGSTRDSTSRDINDYNSFVQEEAAGNTLLGSFSSRFRAVASVPNVHARDNTGTTGTGVPIYWVSGAKVADDYPDFYDGSWDSRAGTDQLGQTLPAERDPAKDLWATLVLTGTNDDGAEAGSYALGASNQPAATSLDRATPFHAFITTTRQKGAFYALSPVLEIEEPGGL